MTIDKIKMGKKSRAAGASFELRVRKDLESKGWIVDKWSNNVEFGGSVVIKDNEKEYLGADFSKDVGKLIPAKHKFRGMGIPMAMGTGFPDFIAFRPLNCKMAGYNNIYEVIGVESKTNGYLDKVEKEKCRWLLAANVFSKILIAKKTKDKNKIVIVYEDFTYKDN